MVVRFLKIKFPIDTFTMQQALHINPMKVDRKSTNFVFIFVFILIFFIWLYFAIGASYQGSTTSPNDVFIKINFSWELPLLILASGLIAFVYTYFLSRFLGSVIVHITVWLMCVFMILIITISIRGALLIFERVPIVYYLVYILLLIETAYVITSFYCARKVGLKLISEIIKDSARALISRPAIPIFAFAMSIISNVVVGFIFIVLYGSSYAYSISLYYGLFALMNVFTNFTQVVISGCIIDWFWAKHQQSNSLTICRSIGRTFSFHLGTVAFASIPLLSHICSIFHLLRCRISDDDFIKKYHFIIRFFSQLSAFLYIDNLALIQTAIYGYGHWTAIMAAHDLVAQNNHRINLAVSEVSAMIIWFGCLLMCIPFLVVGIQLPLMLACSWIIPFYIVFRTAVRALTVNKMIIEYTSESAQEDRDGGRKVALPRSQTSV